MRCEKRWVAALVRVLWVAVTHPNGLHWDGPDVQGARARAHQEHLAHGRDLGRVEVERLVERQRALPS